MRAPLLRALSACVLLIGCAGEDGSSTGHTHDGVSPDAGEVVIEDDGFVGCPDTIPKFAPGMRASGERAVLGATLVEASNVPPRRYLNDWTLALTRADGSALADVVLTKARAFMPVHGHDGIVPPALTSLAEPGRVQIRGLNLNMRGPWEIQLSLSSPSAGDDYVVFHICVQE